MERPNLPAKALNRMRSMVGLNFAYQLGTGNRTVGTPRGPWDCVGAAINEAYEITRHRPGFARGALPPGWEKFADVTDDINTNSAIKDALINQDLFKFVPKGEMLQPGDLLAYPTIIIKDADDGEVHKFIGHVMMVENPNLAVSGGHYSVCAMIHCHGPDGRRPAVTRANGAIMDRHNEVWPKDPHKAWPLRVVP